jgi:hypothetical protein
VRLLTSFNAKDGEKIKLMVFKCKKAANAPIFSNYWASFCRSSSEERI